MLPLTLGLLVYSLFMRVGCSVCVTLPLIIIYLSLTPVLSVVLILLHTCHGYGTCKYTLHNLAIPWEKINNDTLNTSW